MSSATSAPRRATRKDATANRAAIIAAAATALNRDPEAPIEAIAAAAGLSRRALYGHFSGRDALLEEVLLRGAERVGASVAMVAHEDARVELALIGATMWSEVASVRVMAQLAVRGPHAATITGSLEPIRRRLLDTVRRGAEAGTVRTDIPVVTLARLIEGAALSVLDEAISSGVSAGRGHRLVMLAVLATAGLDWRAAGTLIDESPELAFDAATGNGRRKQGTRA